MLPVIQIGPLAVQTYLLLLFAGWWMGLEVGARVARHLGLDGDHVYNGGLLALLAGLVAGRLAHVVAFWPAYRSEPLAIIGINTRAFLLWPALLAALLAAAVYVRRHRLPRDVIADACAAGGLAFAAVLDLANLLAGRAPGAPSSLPWAITLWDVPRHPSQVYEMLAALAALGAVLWVVRRAYVPGRAAWTAVLGYGLGRLALEPFRAESAAILGGLRAAQVLGLAAALLALWGLRRLVLPGQEPALPAEAQPVSEA